jgi:hypothetical protein
MVEPTDLPANVHGQTTGPARAAAGERDFRHLPDPIPSDQLTTAQPATDARDPDLGRDPNHDWLLRGI